MNASWESWEELYLGSKIGQHYRMFNSLKTSVWAPALMRRAEASGAFASVIHKGDPDAGAALVKVRYPDGQSILYRPMREMSGERIWLPKGPLSEPEIDGMIQTRLETDPDLWVIEIEDRDGRHFLTERVEELFHGS